MRKYKVSLDDGSTVAVEADNVEAGMAFVRCYNLDPISLGGTTVRLFRTGTVLSVDSEEMESVAS